MSTVRYHATWMAHLDMRPVDHCVLLYMGRCSSKTILPGNIKVKSQSSGVTYVTFHPCTFLSSLCLSPFIHESGGFSDLELLWGGSRACHM